MSVNRVLRSLAGLLIATVLLWFILPLFGIASSKFLPPPIVFNNATGIAKGVVIGKDVSPTANPFKTGDHVYLINYAFRAPPPLARGETKPGPTERYFGSVRVEDESTYDAVKTDDPIAAIRYEKTYPDINGVDGPEGGRSVGPGSNILSGWILFLLLDFAVAYGIMMILERFGRQEDL